MLQGWSCAIIRVPRANYEVTIAKLVQSFSSLYGNVKQDSLLIAKLRLSMHMNL